MSSSQIRLMDEYRVDDRIRETFVVNSSAVCVASLYDNYLRAFRWAMDNVRRGIICFVVNNSFLDSSAADGFRKELESYADKIYIYNLRGNARTSGEHRRKEGGKIFGQGSRCGICVIVIIKKMEVTP